MYRQYADGWQGENFDRLTKDGETHISGKGDGSKDKCIRAYARSELRIEYEPYNTTVRYDFSIGAVESWYSEFPNAKGQRDYYPHVMLWKSGSVRRDFESVQEAKAYFTKVRRVLGRYVDNAFTLIDSVDKARTLYENLKDGSLDHTLIDSELENLAPMNQSLENLLTS
mgnify:CR=1 FL=1